MRASSNHKWDELGGALAEFGKKRYTDHDFPTSLYVAENNK